jgi:hypothetical protein
LKRPILKRPSKSIEKRKEFPALSHNINVQIKTRDDIVGKVDDLYKNIVV